MHHENLYKDYNCGLSKYIDDEKIKKYKGNLPNITDYNTNTCLDIDCDDDGGLDDIPSNDNKIPTYTLYISAPILTTKKQKIRRILHELWFLRFKVYDSNIKQFGDALNNLYPISSHNGPIYLYINLSSLRNNGVKYFRKHGQIFDDIHTVIRPNEHTYIYIEMLFHILDMYLLREKIYIFITLASIIKK